jgi:hypothetical protein
MSAPHKANGSGETRQRGDTRKGKQGQPEGGREGGGGRTAQSCPRSPSPPSPPPRGVPLAELLPAAAVRPSLPFPSEPLADGGKRAPPRARWIGWGDCGLLLVQVRSALPCPARAALLCSALLCSALLCVPVASPRRGAGLLHSRGPVAARRSSGVGNAVPVPTWREGGPAHEDTRTTHTLPF